MPKIAFFDTEIDGKGRKVLDIGCMFDNGSQFHDTALERFGSFLQDAEFICGHNIFQHDLKYIDGALKHTSLNVSRAIDTLYFSPLLFPQKPYHRLLKDDKLQTEAHNNPLNDAQKARDLFQDEVLAWTQLKKPLQIIYYLLLYDKKEFSAFFKYIGFESTEQDVLTLILQSFKPYLCIKSNLNAFITEYPIALAYSLGLIACQHRYSIMPPWVLKNFPEVERIMSNLRNRPCLEGCLYCNQNLDIFKGLKDFFGFESYRKYAGEPLQENAVRAAIQNKSLLAVFPTGGGKSITFQVPALMQGHSMKGLTVVISPLQSLMKDQVDNLEKQSITEAVTINGLLDPIERAKSFERVEDGSATMLYISPESLRSKSIERLLLNRKVVRFVVDEAHCFSSWGQDFRVDYLYIGDFIQQLQEKKGLQEAIPVSCFTATAKQKVIEDICLYFKDKLGLELEIFSSNASRTNLHYKVFEKENENEKYNALRNLIAEKNCPAIVYVSRTKKAFQIAEQLTADGFNARPYHGKMESTEKTANQNAFIEGSVQIMVATSAFGMGVDKKDVGLVVHFDISDSLENYVQEAGRAGRDENLQADCFVLFNEDDLSKHFILLNQTKLNINEIKQIWNAIKFITKYRTSVSNSPLEIARKAGWDDSVNEIETRVTTAIAALEDAGYLRRGQNMPRIYANSILSKTAQEAIEKIESSTRFKDDRQKMDAKRIIKKLFSSKSKQQLTDEAAEARIDYISDHLGIVKEDVIDVINLLREEHILADAKDLTAFIKRGEHKNRSLGLLEIFRKIEESLLTQINEIETDYSIKTLNEDAQSNGVSESTPRHIKTVLNIWAIKNWIKRYQKNFSNHIVAIKANEPIEIIREKSENRHQIARFIVEVLYEKSKSQKAEAAQKDEVLVEFSILELLSGYKNQGGLFQVEVASADIEDALFYLSRIEALKIEGGFMVVHNRLSIVRLEENNKVQYKNEDYQKLNQFYENKVQQIHIVGEYAKKMIDDYVGALRFVDDYFQLNYSSFLGKHFPGSRQNEIKRNITPAKYRQLFESLSPVQRLIIDDNTSPHIVVAAGPGSGKTRVLVHKLAALLLMEDVKHEQLLMLTFSRAAATEFKKRLIDLIGNAAYYIEIKTFHSYCFDLLGKVGNLEKSDKILAETVSKIKRNEIEINKITKTVLVIDEAQDMNADEYALVETLIEINEGMRVIAVGDDDQNIYQFRGADSKYFSQLIFEKKAVKYELTTNYRSKNNLVNYFNSYARTISKRLKESSIGAQQHSDGILKIVEYKSNNLIVPLVEDLMTTDLTGTTCVLTKTNEEAALIAGLLSKQGQRAKLIQSNEGFPLQNLLEVRYFLDVLDEEKTMVMISDNLWHKAKKAVHNTYKDSPNFEVILNLVKDFQEINPKYKYRTDFEAFVVESQIENFYRQDGDTVFVSTIHKAKGKEFDNVFLMLDGFGGQSDDAKRQVYVAMTRAKNMLSLHTNSVVLRPLLSIPHNYLHNLETFDLPQKTVSFLTLKDVNLGYFPYIQHRVSQLKSGEELKVHEDGLADGEGKLVLKFSNKYREEISRQASNGYILTESKVQFLVFWTNKEDEKEHLVVLPEVVFEKT